MKKLDEHKRPWKEALLAIPVNLAALGMLLYAAQRFGSATVLIALSATAIVTFGYILGRHHEKIDRANIIAMVYFIGVFLLLLLTGIYGSSHFPIREIWPWLVGAGVVLNLVARAIQRRELGN